MQNTAPKIAADSAQQGTNKQVSTWQQFRRLFGYTRGLRAGFALSIIGMLAYAGIDTLFFSQLQPLIDDGLTNANPNILKYAPIFVLVAFALRGVCHFIATYCLAWMGNHVVMRLRQQLFEHIVAMPVPFHDQESTGNLISKITYDTEQLLNAVSKALLTLIKEGAFVIGLLGLMFYYSWQLSAIFLLIVPVVAGVVVVVSKRFRAVSSRIQKMMGIVTSASEQTFNGHKVVLTFGGQQREFERFAKINNQNRQQRMKLVAAKASSVPVIQIIASFALAFVLYMAGQDGFIETLTPGIFTTVVTCMIMLLRPLKMLTTVNSEFQRGMAAAASVFEVLDQEVEQDSGTLTVDRVKGDIVFEDVSFSYQGSEKQALKNISFALESGKSLALVGRSGSGKSTISSLLLRFYHADSGAVKIDGENIRDYQLSNLRRQFAYVSQQVVLFNDTLANNIAYGKPEATRAEIETAAKAAHVLEFAEGLPEGLDTNIGENGSMLSGGQRQRVAIARALLCDAPILILDEATSALDTESERHIQDALTHLQKNRTSVVIAHRLSTIENADNIVVMDQGELIEQGSHSELLAKGGAYAQLHAFQFGQ
ncbi:lipid A export permease/ATP-binding protein MsbA [Thalassotalea ponticola]|uniref:lipid A export permease/ATP-binding protein MsbA n=1 Tax=Thalassotalea ponticola TaxID=1523392 RepID=UPI0025B4AA3C|nr:lipid A export permease/ATP-binding protein MsbA [Thalassotalea ponticola]MDN3652623.1 lipid A export permease/ATP-binding protein MsbA [Thalassotalea ponticola]